MVPEPYDHYRVEAGHDWAAGVYRVVGVDEETVTLLYVADPDGSRVNAGRVRRVPRTEFDSAFTEAANPDAGMRPGQVVDWVVETVRMGLGWVRRW
ncbi:MAG: hypothetical protein ABEJ08_05200 [Halobacteriaceae archaeon]